MGRLLILLFALAISVPGFLFLSSQPLHAPLAGARALPAEERPSTAVQLMHPGYGAARLSLAARDDSPPKRVQTHAIVRKLPTLYLPSVLPDRTIRVPILMYHHVSAIAPTTDLNFGLTVTDADFSAQLAYLRHHGYHTVLLRQVFAAMYKHGALPSKPVVLTFDDGYLDNYTDALPILRRFHAVAEFNIISAYVGISVGINSYMSWPQLKTLVRAGMEIGSHTVDHQDLGVLTDAKIRFELRDSRNLLQRNLGVAVQFLAYPSGEPFRHGDQLAQQRVLRLVPQYGYVGALLDGPLTTGNHDARLPFQLWRIRVAGGEELDTFASLLQA